MSNKLDYNSLVSDLEKWFDFHHGDCNDQTTCAISEAWNQGYTIIAIDLLLSAIGIDINNTYNKNIESRAEKSYELIKKHFKTKWKKDIKKENKLLLKINHLKCECGAIIWQPEMCDNYCSSCGK